MCSRSRSRARARSARRCPRRCGLIAPPSEEALRNRLVGRGTDDPEQVEARLATANEELAAQGEFPHVVIDDRLDDAVEALEEVVRASLISGPNPEEGRPLISPRVDRLLENIDSPYASVIVAAKRARQINSYYHNLGEGTFEELPPPMVNTGSKNYLTIALEEVAGGKVKYRYRGQ